MAAVDWLPRRYKQGFRRSAYPSAALRNTSLLADPSYETVYTHFLGDNVTAEWPAAKTNGTSAAVTYASSKLTLTTGTDDDGYAGQGFGMFWTGTKGWYFACELSTPSAITTLKFEVGVSDATDDAGAIGTKATPTNTATDCVVCVFDTDDNTELDIIEVNSGSAAEVATNIVTVATSTSYTFEFVGKGTEVEVFVNGVSKGTGTLTAATAITPWVFAQARAGAASRVVTCDWWFMTGSVA